MRAAQIVEAVLFASDAPLRAEEIARADSSLDEDVVEEAVQELQREYDDGERAYEIREVAGGYQVMTRPEFAPYLERFDTVPRPSRLSGPALETLAIIAYRQPIGRIEIEYIRGVGSSGVIRTLQDRALVEVVGRAEGLGRPLLYGTGARFLEHFGFQSLDDLPRPDELPVVLRDRTPLGLDGDAAEPAEAGADGAAVEGAVSGGEPDDVPATKGTRTEPGEGGESAAAADGAHATIDLSRADDVDPGALEEDRRGDGSGGNGSALPAAGAADRRPDTDAWVSQEGKEGTGDPLADTSDSGPEVPNG